ncbi:hypothetical protein BMF35_a0586 [Aurantiacibacter gangjinensis]|nr:hypothetical protein BMF35_a0586 [Aurantiacibacter gangjinensis]
MSAGSKSEEYMLLAVFAVVPALIATAGCIASVRPKRSV